MIDNDYSIWYTKIKFNINNLGGIFMKNKKIIFLVSLLTLLTIILTGCYSDNSGKLVKEITKLEKNKDKHNEKIEDIENTNESDDDDENIESNREIKLNLGEKAIMSEEEFITMYKNDTDMLGYINQFVGRLAPDFKMIDLNNNEMNLSDFKGENIIVDFMGSWCSACKNSIPATKSLNDKYSDLKVISVSVDEDRKSVV